MKKLTAILLLLALVLTGCMPYGPVGTSPDYTQSISDRMTVHFIDVGQADCALLECDGEYIIIDHGGGVTTLYAHMSSRLYGVGDTVSAGDTIGYVGLTGNTRGYHLHFETRENGSRVDPANYLSFPADFRYY